MKKLAKPAKGFQLADLKRFTNEDLRVVIGGEDKTINCGTGMSKAIYQ